MKPKVQYVALPTRPIPLLIILLASFLTLASCTKEDTGKWIDGTTWRYTKTDGEHKVNVTLSLSKGGGLTITDKNSYYWNDKYEYSVTSYTYDGEKSGTIQLRGINYYAEDNATATFSLNYDQREMHLHSPNGSYTLKRTN